MKVKQRRVDLQWLPGHFNTGNVAWCFCRGSFWENLLKAKRSCGFSLQPCVGLVTPSHGLLFFNVKYATIKTVWPIVITHSGSTLNRFQFRLNCSYALSICIFTTFSTKHAIWRESPLVSSQLPRFACAPTKLYFLLGKFEINPLQHGFNHRDGT